MPTYLSPGVYVEEVDSGSRPIEGVGTAVAAFVGLAEDGPFNAPTLVTNWTQFTTNFGDFVEGSYLAHAVYGYFLNGGGNCYVVRIGQDERRATARGDGPRRCAAGPQGQLGRLPGRRAGRRHARTDRSTVDIADARASAPPRTASSSLVRAGRPGARGVRPGHHRAGQGQRRDRGQRASKLIRIEEPASGPPSRRPARSERRLSPPPPPAAVPVAAADHRRLRRRRRRPHRLRRPGGRRRDHHGLRPRPDERLPAGRDRPGGRQGRPAGDDRPLRADGRPGRHPRPAARPERRSRSRTGGSTRPATTRSTPRCTGRGSRSPTRPPARTCYVPPCGHIAGIWGRNDDTRGVHKAPANEVVRGAISPRGADHQERARPAQPGRASTASAPSPAAASGSGAPAPCRRDPAWRYLNVRRLFNYLEESILNGTQWVVFEPNDDALWAKIRRTISAFLVNEWRKGALFGLTPDEAFYVKCDRETNPAEGIDAGQVVCEIGVAPVKPAEFVDLPARPSSPAAPAWSPSRPTAADHRNRRKETPHGTARRRQLGRPLVRTRVRRRHDQEPSPRSAG